MEQKPNKSKKFIFRNGSRYEGEFVNQNGTVFRHGRGKYTESLTKLD